MIMIILMIGFSINFINILIYLDPDLEKKIIIYNISSMEQNASNIQVETKSAYTKKASILQEKDYLKKFHQFLEQKLKRGSIKKQNTNIKCSSQINQTKRLLASHLNKKKLTQNNSENRINKIMDQFKSLDTYVNIKNFIREINLINYQTGKQQISVRESHHNQVPINQDHIIQSSQFQRMYANIFQKANIYAGSQINKNIIKSSQFINRFTKSMNSSRICVDQNSEQNIFQSLFLNQMIDIEDENEYKLNEENNFTYLQKKLKYQKNKKQQIPKKSREPQVPIQINQKYYEDFKRKATDIQSKLHQMLQNMHLKKWKNRQNELSIKKKQIKIKNTFFNHSDSQNKPVLNAKYKLYAPKNMFNFKTFKDQPLNKQTPWNRRRNGKILLDSKVNNKQNLNFKETILPVLQLQQKKFNKVKSKSRLKVCKNMVLNQINDIKSKYNFKNPLVKENILRKIMEFITDIEDKQYGFKRKNAQLSKSINKFQENKKLDFDKFLDENLEIDTQDLKNIGLNIKKLK